LSDSQQVGTEVVLNSKLVLDAESKKEEGLKEQTLNSGIETCDSSNHELLSNENAEDKNLGCAVCGEEIHGFENCSKFTLIR
jgi:hypothetical protein